MTVGILLVTHHPLGSDLLRIASDILGARPAGAEALEVVNDTPCETLVAESIRLADKLDTGDGVLVLTDVYGATPSNVALVLRERHPSTRTLAGVNLPMLLRALNYAKLDLDTVTAKAMQGGREGVRLCEPHD